jgi:hypothetical protein
MGPGTAPLGSGTMIEVIARSDGYTAVKWWDSAGPAYHANVIVSENTVESLWQDKQQIPIPPALTSLLVALAAEGERP